MRSHPRHAVTLLAGLLGVAGPAMVVPTLAQATHAQATLAPPTTRPQTSEPTASDTVIDLQLDSVSLRDYVDYLSDVSNANIILMNGPDLDPARVKLPKLKLRQIRVEDAIALLQWVPGLYIEIDSDTSGKVPTFLIRAATPSALPGDEARVTTRVMPLERMLLGEDAIERIPDAAERTKLLEVKVPQTLQLIEEALMMQFPNGNVPELNLHQPTQTLLVKGNQEQYDVVNEVIHALSPPKPSDEKRAFEMKADKLTFDFEKQRSLLAMEVEALRSRLDQADAERFKAQAELNELRAKQLYVVPQPAPSTQP